MNRFEITAVLIESEALRYTPAGIPVLQCRLHSVQTVQEAGVDRLVDIEIEAKAIGDAAYAVSRLPLNTQAVWTGFLARKSKTARSLCFHIDHFRVSPEQANDQRFRS